MLPWFFPRHIFSDRQEAFVSAPQVRVSSTEMGKENRKFISVRVLICLLMCGSESITYPDTAFVGSSLTKNCSFLKAAFSSATLTPLL